MLAIDGTGPFSDTEYLRKMRNSFVSYIYRRSPAGRKMYLRGPWADGLDMGIIVNRGFTFVNLNRVERLREEPVLLVGYSRGGAGVISVSHRLQERGIPVNSLMLFDAVDRSLLSNTETDSIPSNVARTIHVRRSPSSLSRRSFSNCGINHASVTQYEQEYFLGTHGALGGVPWRRAPLSDDTLDQFQRADMLERLIMLRESAAPINEGFPEFHPTRITYEQDRRTAREIWRWVEPRLVEMGFLSA